MSEILHGRRPCLIHRRPAVEVWTTFNKRSMKFRLYDEVAENSPWT
jgi:hypothetical protein